MAYPFQTSVARGYWLKLKNCLRPSNDNQLEKAGGYGGLSAQHRFTFESLEPRLLFSADPITAAVQDSDLKTITHDMDSQANDLLVRIIEQDDSSVLQLLDNSDPDAPVVYETTLDSKNHITITGTDGDDTLTLDQSVIDLDGDTLLLTFSAGAGTDTLTGADSDSRWLLTDVGSGTLANLTFSGMEVLVGGSGEDTLDYSTYDIGVTVDLGQSLATGFDTVSGFEAITGSAYDDTLIGNSSDNTLSGGGGNDTFDGGAGHDTVQESHDADFVLTDIALTIGSDSSTLSDIEEIHLTGGASANILDASAYTGSGVTLDGGAGDDQLLGTTLDDQLTGGLGADIIHGGLGTDILVESGDNRFVLTDTTLDRGDGTSEIQTLMFNNVTSGSYTLTYDGKTTSTLSWDASAEEISLALRMLDGIGDEDIGITVNDDGSLALAFVGNLAARNIDRITVTSSLNSGGSITVSKSDGTTITDTLTGIEQAHLTGGDGDNRLDASAFSGVVVLDGGNGDNILIGGSGDDTLIGGSGSDILTGGAGSDDIRGGGSVDTLIESADVDFTLTNTGLIAGSDTNTLSGIEQVQLTGGASANIIDTSGFNGLNEDVFLTQLNNGADVGRVSGNDFQITLSDDTTVIGIDLSYSLTIQDVLDTITNAHDNLSATLSADGTAIVITDTTGGNSAVALAATNGSTAADDLGLTLGTGTTAALTGTALTAGYVTIDGGAGADQITGTIGNDYLTGGTGADTITGGDGSDTLIEIRDADFTLTNTSLIIGTEGADTLSGIEQPHLTGGTSANTLDASAFTLGALVLATGGGADTLKGGSHSDQFVIDTTNLTSGTDRVTINVGGGNNNEVIINDSDSLLTQSDFDWVIWDGDASAEYTVNGGDSLTVTEDISAAGQNIKLRADTIKIKGYTIDTGGNDSAGHLTLKGYHITIDDGAQLLAQAGTNGGSDGNITISAIDDRAIWTTGFANIDYISVDITIGNATISGGNVVVEASADSRYYLSEGDFNNAPLSQYLAAGFSGVISSTETSLFAGVAVSTSKAKVRITSAATINAADFSADANAYVRTFAAPISPMLGIAVGVAITEAKVTIDGTINTTGDAFIRSLADHSVNVVADASAAGTVAGAVAVSVIDSLSQVHVTDSAQLNVGNHLEISADTVDRNRTLARSTAGKDGTVGIAIAVSSEYGETNAFLDGSADVGGNLVVQASQHKEAIELNKLFVVPSRASGVTASSGVGTESTGDLLDDTKGAAIDKMTSWITTPISNYITSKLPTSDSVWDFDVAAALAVVVDQNHVEARLGDGDTSQRANIEADGTIDVTAVIANRPDITTTSSATDEGVATGDTSKAATAKGISLAVGVGVYINDAEAVINGDATVDAGDKITVDAQTLNQIDPNSLWGANLVTPFLDENTQATHSTDDGVVRLSEGDTVDVNKGFSGEGNTGSRYKYISAIDQDIDLSTTDFTNENYWEELGNVVADTGMDFVRTLTSYLNGNLGLENNLVDSWSSATASGQKLAVAGAAAVLVMEHDASATIKDGALINQNLALRSGQQDVEVTATSVSHAIALAGNFKTFGITGGSSYSKNWKPSTTKPGFGTSAADGGDAVGGTFGLYSYHNNVTAKIADGVTLYADSLEVDADNEVLSVTMGASGGSADNVSFNGSFLYNVVDDTTLAWIDNGATITLGSSSVNNSDGNGATLFVDADHTAHIINGAGGITSSEHIGIGMSMAGNFISRDTEALIGNRHDNSASDTRGSITVGGDVKLSANNGGFIGAFAIAGAKAVVNPVAGTGSADSGTGGQSSDGSTASSTALLDWQTKMSAVLAEMKTDSRFADSANQANTTGAAKSGTSVSGSITLNVVDDNARAYIYNSGALDSDALIIRAGNGSHVGSLSGSVAYAYNSTAGTSKGLAGAIGVNVMSGTSSAFLDGSTQLTASSLDFDASRDGWVVALTAGVGAASGGTSASGMAGSVSVNFTDYTTEVGLRNLSDSNDNTVDADIDGTVSLLADDNTNMVIVAGSGGFGSKAGVGASIAFAEIQNTTKAQINNVDSLKHDGALDIEAKGDGMLVTITGSGAAATGDQSGSGFAIAGTLSVNYIDNTITAGIINTTTTANSTGSVTVIARDDSSIFSLSGGFAYGKTLGFGAAFALNFFTNNVTSKVDNSTLRTSGNIRVKALQNSASTALSVGGAGSDKIALAGSFSVNQSDNTIDALIKGGSNVQAGGLVQVKAEDDSTNVVFAGGLAFSNKGALGAGVGINLINNDTTAAIDNATVASTGDELSVQASAKATVVSVVIGGAGASSFALGGAIAVNEVGNSVVAKVINSADLDALNDISVSASDNTTVVVVAGGGAGSKTAAIGAAIATAEVSSTIRATVDDASLTSSSGNVSVLAGYAAPEDSVDLAALGVETDALPDDTDLGAQIINVTLAGAGANTFAMGAAISLNWLRNTVEATISNGADIDAQGDIQVAASDDASITSVAVGAAGASTGAVGAAISYNYIGGDPGDPSRDVSENRDSIDTGIVRASIADATVDSSAGSVSVLADSTASIVNITIGAAGASTGAVAGSISINFMRNLVNAAILDGAEVTAYEDVNVRATTTPVMIIVAGAGSGAGTGAASIASATNDMRNDIQARIEGDGTVVTAESGDIIVAAAVLNTDQLPSVVLADDGDNDSSDDPILDAQIWSFAVSGSGAGTAAGAGSLALNWIRNSVEARIADSAEVSAEDSSGLVAVTAADQATINALAGGGSGAGTAAIGAAVAYNYIGGNPDDPDDQNTTNSVVAVIDNAVVDADTVLVSANSDADINSFSVALTGSGTFAGSGALSLNWIRKTVTVQISGGAEVTTTGAVDVLAQDSSRIRAGSTQISGSGTVAIGGTVAYNEIENSITAAVDSSTVTVTTGNSGDITVAATSTATIDTLSVGISGSGKASVAGSGVSSRIDNSIAASIDSSTVSTDDDLLIQAESRDTINSYAGTLSGSGAAGVGASVAVAKLTGTTSAYIAGSDIDVGGDLDVTSTTTENMLSFTATGALGAVGVAASVTVVDSSSATRAWIGSAADGTNSDIDAIGNITVRAINRSTIDNDTGTGAVAGTGVGAAIDVITVKNSVTAYIGQNSLVTAGAAITVSAQAERTVDALAIGFGGGAGLGVSGAVSVISLGTGMDGTGYEQATPAQSMLSGTFDNDTVLIAEDETVSGITAYIGDGAEITADDITVQASESVDVTQTTGAGAGGGLAGVGGAVAVLNLSGATTAFVDNNTDLSATDDITIQATFSAEEVNVNAYGGTAGGIVGIGAQVAIINDSASQHAFIDHGTSSSDGARITRADALIVQAEASRNYSVQAKGVTAGSLAAGAAVGDVDIGGITLAYIGDYTQIGQDSDTVTSLTVTSSSTAAVTGNIWSVAAGIGAGSGNDANVRIDPTVKAFVGQGAAITVSGAVTVQATATPKADITVHGVNAGGLAVGVSLTDITLAPTVIAALGDADDDSLGDVHITADSLTVTAQTLTPDSGYSAKADSLGVSGALIGVDATKATINNNSTVKSFVASGSTLVIAGATTLSASHNSKQKAEADSYAGGLLAAGGSSATVKSNTTTQAFFAGDVALTGSSLQITAVGNDNNLAEVTAGAGGLAGGSGSEAFTVNTSTVTAEIRGDHNDQGTISMADDRAIDLTGQGAGTLVIKAEQNADFDSEIVVGSGGLLGATGAKADHDVTANVTAGIGEDALVRATDIDLDAITKLRRDAVSGNNIKGTTGGVASAAGADSFTNIDMTTRVVIGDSASITVIDGAAAAGDMTIDALNDFILNDKVTLISGGALAGAGSTLEIKTDTNIAEVVIGEDAVLESAGELLMSARGTGSAIGKVNVETYGVGTVAIGNTKVIISPDNRVSVGANSTITAYGDLKVSAGTDTGFNRDQYTLEARTDSFAGSAIPISDLDATANLKQSNTITISTGALLETARDVKLHAERLGFADMTAKAKGVSWASALAESMGGSEVFAGSIDTEASGRVIVDGSVRTGIDRKQKLVLDDINNGQVIASEQTDGIQFSTSSEQLDSGLIKELKTAQKQLNQYKDSDATLRAFYQSEVDRITTELEAMGLWTTNGQYSGYTLQDVPVIVIEAIWAQAGTIDVRSDTLEGSGELDAPGDAGVEIINHTNAFLDIQGITIPSSTGGLFLNGVEMADNSEVNSASQADEGISTGSASFATITAGGQDNPPAISITNTFDNTLAANSGTPAPSITISGQVANVQGDLNLVNPKGDIVIDAQVSAKNMNVIGRSVYITGLTDYSVGGETYSKLDHLTNNGQQAANAALVNAQLTQNSGAVSLYGDRIVIDTEYLNLNGIMQSGKADYNLVLGSATASEIASIGSSASGLIKLQTASTDDYSVYFNTATNRIEVQEIKVGGGYIDLEGHMLNTGYGEIRLLGGYGEISVTNNTAYDVVVHELDASQRGDGTLIIKDKAKGTSDNPHVTIYTKTAAGVTISETGKNNRTGSDSDTYGIKSGWRYGWSVDVLDATRNYKTEKQSSWLGVDALAADPPNDYWDTTERLEGPSLTDEGPYYYLDANTSAAYTHDSVTVTDSERTYVEDRWSTSTWYGKKTYYTKYVNEQYTTTTHTHTVKADNSVNINFIGYDAGAVSVTSTVAGADIVIDGAIRNSSGTTTLTSAGNIRQSGTDSSVSGQKVVLRATGDIGQIITDDNGDMVDSGAVTINLTENSSASLTAVAGGEVHIASGSGDLTLNKVRAGSGETVRLHAQQSITTAVQSSVSSVITGGTIELIAREGAVGKSDQLLTLDSGSELSHSLSVEAKTGLFIEETSGDLRLKQAVASSGDLVIQVDNGGLHDANDSAVRDERAYNELLNGVWSDLQLTEGTGANDKINQTLADYIANREREYDSYWQYRNQQMDASVYDSGFVVSPSVAEQEYYESTGWTDGEIQTLVNKRTEEYHNLHSRFGQYGDSYNDSFTYTLSEAEETALVGSIKIWSEAELLNLFSAGLIAPVTDTQTVIEATNISAFGSVTLQVADGIGSASGSLVIDLSDTNITLTDDERVALAAAERTDVAYLAGAIVSAKVDFFDTDGSGDTITRIDNGSWLDDGFTDGMTIQVFGQAGNASSNGQFYTIVSVSDNAITLIGGDELTAEYGVDITLAHIVTDPTADGVVIEGIRIDQQDDIDVDAGGAITATASDDIFLGSERDIKLNTITAGDTVRIKTASSILNLAGDSATNITSTDMILEAADGSIGSTTDGVYVNLAADAIFTARVSGDIYLTERTGNINVGTLYAQSGGIFLTAATGSIVDGLNHSFANISAATELVLTAAGSIGEESDYLETDLGSNATLTITANGNIAVHEVLGNMSIKRVLADGGDVDLRAHLAILDAADASGATISGLPEADVIGNNITLSSDLDSIGVSGNDLDIDSGYRSAGTVTTHSALDTYLIETEGDLLIATIGTGSDYTAFIMGRDRILNGLADPAASNISSGKTRLFAEGDIGSENQRLQTTVGYMEGRSTSGSVWITNTGHLTVGGLDQEQGLVAEGSVDIRANSPLTVSKGIVSAGSIYLRANEDDNDATVDEQDNLVIESGVVITAGNELTLSAGDDLVIESGAVLAAAGAILIRGDYREAAESGDNTGTNIAVYGTLSGTTITITGASDNDTIFIDAVQLTGDTSITGGAGDDSLIVHELHSRTESLSLDGEGGSDHYTVTVASDANDYTIDIHDSGAVNDGVDQLTINGRGFAGDTSADQDDTFLIRSNFIAQLHGDATENGLADQVERINYDSSLNDQSGGVLISGHDGNDRFITDDTSALMTIDGGAGLDSFQVGQIFGDVPVTALGDEINGTAVSRGYLSYGNSELLTLNGGEGSDDFTVYSNKARLLLSGDEGNDRFVVRAFVAEGTIDLNGGADDDTIDYNVNAPLNIDGGSGFDTLTAIGTEANDTFIITRDAIRGAGLDISYDGVEAVDVDAMEGDDTFIIESSREGVITTLIGGLGSDHFIVGSEGLTSAIQGSLILEGGSTLVDRTLKMPVVLPDEQATAARDIPAITDETLQTDSITVFNDASLTDDTGRLTTTTLTGLNMDNQAMTIPGANADPDRVIPGGISYFGIDQLEVVLGAGNDQLAIDATALTLSAHMTMSRDEVSGISSITLADGSSWFEHGFRAGDSIVISDTESDAGSLYHIASFSNDGNRLFLAESTQFSNATVSANVQRQNPITVVHGGGNQAVVDALSGKQTMGGDNITITGTDIGNIPLVIFGDTGQDGSRYQGVRGDGLGTVVGYTNAGDDRIDASSSLSGMVIYGGMGDDTIFGSQGDDRLGGGSGDDTISGLAGNDLLYGDGGFNIDLTERLTLTTEILTVVTVPNVADDDVHSDTLITGSDTLDGGEDDDVILGDHGLITQNLDDSWQQQLLLSMTQITNIKTTTVVEGGNDTISDSDGFNRIVGGVGSDTIITGTGDDHILGDNGIIQYNSTGLLTVIETTDFDLGGHDIIAAGDGNNVILAGYGRDIITTGSGADNVIGDNGRMNFANGTRVRLETLDSTEATGGADTIQLGGGADQALGGVGGDTISKSTGGNSAGESVIIGDDGYINSDASGRYITAATGSTTLGGDDRITGGADRDILLGGVANDTLDGQGGSDLIIGDGGKLTRTSTSLILETIDFFTGGNDTLRGGTGLDRMIGGFGNDIFDGNLSEDIMIGEYARMTFITADGGERAAVIVTLAPGNLDLLKVTESSLYTELAAVDGSAFLNLRPSSINIDSYPLPNTSADAGGFLDNLFADLTNNTTSGSQAAGVDFILPTAPPAANQADDEEPGENREEACQPVTESGDTGQQQCAPDATTDENGEQPVTETEGSVPMLAMADNPQPDNNNTDSVVPVAAMVLGAAALQQRGQQLPLFNRAGIEALAKKQQAKRYRRWHEVSEK